MSERHRVQDQTGVVVLSDGILISDIITNVAPTNGQLGFQIGCTFTNKLGTVGGIYYVNVGTTTSATWVNIV